ncbi:MAG: hypothetical protein ACTSQI_17880 [Candidatus Helarchaeota archaeon]
MFKPKLSYPFKKIIAKSVNITEFSSDDSPLKGTVEIEDIQSNKIQLSFLISEIGDYIRGYIFILDMSTLQLKSQYLLYQELLKLQTDFIDLIYGILEIEGIEYLVAIQTQGKNSIGQSTEFLDEWKILIESARRVVHIIEKKLNLQKITFITGR